MKQGFTLIELVIAVAIISIALVFLTPRLTLFLSNQKDDPACVALNKLTQAAWKEALSHQKRIVIWGVKDSNNIYIDNKSYALPLEIFSARVNGEYQEGIKYYFCIYPLGIMDKVKLTFENGRSIESEPLLLQWK